MITMQVKNYDADDYVEHARHALERVLAVSELLRPMQVTVQFYSYFKDLTGCSRIAEALPEGSTIERLLANLAARFPKLAAAQQSTLVAVGLDYQDRRYVLKEGDEVSLFPPVQGG